MSFIQQTKYKLLTGLSFLLALNSYFFIERKSANAFPLIFDNIKIHYLIYIACIIGLFWIWHKFLKNKPLFELIKIWLLTLLPTEIVFIFGLYILHSETKAHFIFYFLTGFYLVIAALFFVEKNNNFKPAPKISIKKWLKKQGFATLLLLFLSISTFGYFGVKDLADYAGVDEPLWTFDRIPYFWKNVGEMDWKNTSISDKPGITVVEITGIGLLFSNPSDYAVLENFNPQKDIRLMNLAFRLPLVIFSLLSLVFFYIFIEKLLSRRIALFSTIFIGTSPILIGINRIINPDSILWIFTSLSVLAYLIFLKKETRRWLYWAGFLLGLSILTKYVANILYVFFFGLIFLEYLFQKKPLPVSQYLKKASARFLSVTFISLITFFL
ncbi:MAG: glycosyltransferase family 39 protein, partial [Candidatus Moranbacteria bacterium]|nr:glycosyltransferase family 39 protein [Candidatus Moranbacteria bacterium]